MNEDFLETAHTTGLLVAVLAGATGCTMTGQPGPADVASDINSVTRSNPPGEQSWNVLLESLHFTLSHWNGWDTTTSEDSS